MPDREKVIKELECCVSLNQNGSKCANCDYADEFRNGDCETYLLRDALALLEALPPKHIHEEYPEHDWCRNEDGTINVSAMDCDTHSGPVCKRCGDSFCVFCEPNGFETHKPCVIDEFVCPECGGMVFDGQKYCSRCGRAVKWA